MKPGGMLMLTNYTPIWLRADPVSGGEVEKYPHGTMFILLEEDDPELHHHRVLAPDGKTGWIFKDFLEELK